MRTLIAVAIFISLSSGDGFAQLPIPKNKAKRTAETTATDKRDTDEIPLAVKILPSPNSEAKAAEEKQERDKKAATDDRLVQWTHALFWATVVLAVIAAFQ